MRASSSVSTPGQFAWLPSQSTASEALKKCTALKKCSSTAEVAEVCIALKNVQQHCRSLHSTEKVQQHKDNHSSTEKVQQQKDNPRQSAFLGKMRTPAPKPGKQHRKVKLDSRTKTPKTTQNTTHLTIPNRSPSPAQKPMGRISPNTQNPTEAPPTVAGAEQVKLRPGPPSAKHDGSLGCKSAWSS